jgi:hypothetical protein
MRPADNTMVLRWCRNLDRFHRLVAEADKAPMTSGSKGQACLNPIYHFVLKLEASIREDEKQLGIGPLNRLKLGLAFSEGAKSLADLNAEADEADDCHDPRVGLALVTDPEGA